MLASCGESVLSSPVQRYCAYQVQELLIVAGHDGDLAVCCKLSSVPATRDDMDVLGRWPLNKQNIHSAASTHAAPVDSGYGAI